MSKQAWLSASIIALLLVCLLAVVITKTIETQKLQKEVASIKQHLSSLEKNYSDQQQQFMSVFTPRIETRLGAKVLWDASTGRNYLWVTGEVYNRGYGVAFNTELEIKLFVSNPLIANSTLPKPIIIMYSLGDIEALSNTRVRNAFFADKKIENWAINAACSATK